MARPREFDETEVLDRALQAFWARGYDATSIEHLVEATGIGRASLYGAFGDKEQLFRRVMDRYLAKSRDDVTRVTKGLRGRRALEAFLRSRIHPPLQKKGAPLGCFLQMSATSGTSPPLVQEALALGAQEVGTWLHTYLAEAQEDGDLPKGTSLEELVSVVGVFVSGLTASVKAGQPESELERSIQSTLRLIFGRS